MDENLREKTISGLIWQYAEKCGAQAVGFVVSIILARMLSLEDYGIVGLVTVFISISLVFVESGMGQALVQKKDVDDIDFSTVFYYSLGFSVLIYVALFFLAPIIADFYSEPSLVGIVRVLGLTVILTAFSGVQHARIQRDMRFKMFFYSTFLSTIISAVVGVVMACAGYGVWALVWQQLSSRLITIVILWFVERWKPKLVFSLASMKQLFGYSWKLLASGLIDRIYNNMYTIVIGKLYSGTEVAVYNRGKQFPVLVVENVNGSINSVIFSALSKMQDDKDRFKAAVRRSIKTSTYIIFPLMAGLAAVAEPLVRILLTEKWLPAVPFIQFCCFTYAFWPVHTANLQAVKALGRSDVFLKLEIIKKIYGVAILIITLPFGLTAMMFGRCISTILGSIVNAYPNKKLMDYNYVEQVKDILPSMILSLIMCGIVLLVGMLKINVYMLFALQVVVGIAVYVLLSKLFKLECFEYVLDIIKGFLKKKGTK